MKFDVERSKLILVRFIPTIVQFMRVTFCELSTLTCKARSICRLVMYVFRCLHI